MISKFEKELGGSKIINFEDALKRKEQGIRASIKEAGRVIEELENSKKMAEVDIEMIKDLRELKGGEKIGKLEKIYCLEDKIIDIQMDINEGRELIRKGEEKIAEMREKYQKNKLEKEEAEGEIEREIREYILKELKRKNKKSSSDNGK